MTKVMIYGATGYTGGLISRQAKLSELDFMLTGRTASLLQSIAAELHVSSRVFDLEDSSVIDSNLIGIAVLLNCAGPFAETAECLMEACIRNGVHYLDTSAELDTFTFAQDKDSEAKAANIMLLPGCGGSAVILGCLTSHALEDVVGAESVDLALHVSGPVSQGSAKAAKGDVIAACLERRDGELSTRDSADTADFDFADGRGCVACFPLTLPDLVTVHKFSGVETIRTCANASADAFDNEDLEVSRAGPTLEERNRNPYHAAITIRAQGDVVKRTALHTVNGYTFTYLASVEAAKLVAAGNFAPGFQTSVEVFDADFAKSGTGMVWVP